VIEPEGQGHAEPPMPGATVVRPPIAGAPARVEMPVDSGARRTVAMIVLFRRCGVPRQYNAGGNAIRRRRESRAVRGADVGSLPERAAAAFEREACASGACGDLRRLQGVDWDRGRRTRQRGPCAAGGGRRSGALAFMPYTSGRRVEGGARSAIARATS
jgi:hypothetical protein